MVEQVSEEQELRETAKELGIGNWHNKKIENLRAEIEEINASKDTPTEKSTEPPAAAPDDGLPEVKEAARIEARLKALEQLLVETQEENRRLRDETETIRRTMATAPLKEIPQVPNPNTMVYHKDQVKDGKYFGMQVSPERAKLLYEDGYVDTPAKLPKIEETKK